MTLQATISGRVQGVGFRLFVLDHARRLGLKGYVRNLPDGRVFVLACGSKHALDELMRLLHRGPSGAWVADVRAEWYEGQPADLPDRFEVRY
jgi:acylphosphatase